MRRRRKSIVQWLFFAIAVVLLLFSTLALLTFLSFKGAFGPEWQYNTVEFFGVAQIFLVSNWDDIGFISWVIGIVVSTISAAIALAAGWHFAEINLPRRLEDLKNSLLDQITFQQPRQIELARQGIGPLIPDIEISRMTLVRKWLSAWSEKEGVRVLAASSKHLERQASALSAALKEAQKQQITAHIIRGYQLATGDNKNVAFKEFVAATAVDINDTLSRDIAAGWARLLNDQVNELDILKEMQQAARRTSAAIEEARALRREAELLRKRSDGTDLVDARDRLNDARVLLQPLISGQEAKRELGRVYTLFCDVQCDRTVVGHLRGQSRPLTKAREYMAGIAMHRRAEEPGGEEYGEERVVRAEDRVTELLDDTRKDPSEKD